MDAGSLDHLGRTPWNVALRPMRGGTGPGLYKPMSHGRAEGMPRSVVGGWGSLARLLLAVDASSGSYGDSPAAEVNGSSAGYMTGPWLWEGRCEPAGLLPLARGAGWRRLAPGLGSAERVPSTSLRLSAGDRVMASHAHHG